MLKVELLELKLYKMHRPLPIYVVNETLKQHGHTAIQLPPYHAELNSIELIWAMLKGKVAIKKKDVKKLTEDAFESFRQKTGHLVAGMLKILRNGYTQQTSVSTTKFCLG